MSKVVVRLSLDENTWRLARAIAILERTSVSAIVEEYLRKLSGLEGSDGTPELDGRDVDPSQDESPEGGDVGDEAGGEGAHAMAG
jgi:hypothetical protein